MTLYIAYNNEPCSLTTGGETWLLFSTWKCLGVFKTHVLLCFLWSFFCKWPVINVTLQTLKIAVNKIQD